MLKNRWIYGESKTDSGLRLDCLLFIRIGTLQDYPERHYLQYGKDPSEGSDLIDKWSTCSVEDFKAHYQMFTNIDGSYCLENRIVDEFYTVLYFNLGLPNLTIF